MQRISSPLVQRATVAPARREKPQNGPVSNVNHSGGVCPASMHPANKTSPKRRSREAVRRAVPVDGVVRRRSTETDGDGGRQALTAVLVDVRGRDGLVAAAVAWLDGGGGGGTERMSGPDVGDADDRLVDEDD